MTKTLSQEAKWHFFAKSDLRLSKNAAKLKIFHLACFHAHQATEKYLKSILANKKMPIPKTHSIKELYEMTVKMAPELEPYKEGLDEIDQYYIPTRYPDALPGSLPEGLPNKIHAEKAIITAEKVAKIIKNSSKF